jgi:hypothetical protein
MNGANIGWFAVVVVVALVPGVWASCHVVPSKSDPTLVFVSIALAFLWSCVALLALYAPRS